MGAKFFPRLLLCFIDPTSQMEAQEHGLMCCVGIVNYKFLTKQSPTHTLPKDQPFNLEFQFESVFNFEFQPKFGIQLEIPISLGINLGECSTLEYALKHYWQKWHWKQTIFGRKIFALVDQNQILQDINFCDEFNWWIALHRNHETWVIKIQALIQNTSQCWILSIDADWSAMRSITHFWEGVLSTEF